MAKLGQPGLTVPQKQEVQARWVAGESNEAIAAALGRSTRQIERIRTEDGGSGAGLARPSWPTTSAEATRPEYLYPAG